MHSIQVIMLQLELNKYQMYYFYTCHHECLNRHHASPGLMQWRLDFTFLLLSLHIAAREMLKKRKTAYELPLLKTLKRFPISPRVEILNFTVTYKADGIWPLINSLASSSTCVLPQ